MSTDTKIKTLIFNKLTQEQYNNADRVPTEFYLTPDTSIDSSEKGVANGVASLDTNGKVPSEQIPVATTSTLGGVKPDGTTITVTEDGTISVPASSEVATKAELQNKVNKSGDTITGRLTINYNSQNSLVVKDNRIEMDVVPDSNIYTEIVEAFDKNDKRVASVEHAQLGGGGSRATLQAVKQINGENKYAQIHVGFDSSNNMYATCPTPGANSNSNNIATTQWVRNQSVAKAGDTMTGQLVMENGSNGIRFNGATADNFYYVLPNSINGDLLMYNKNAKGLFLSSRQEYAPHYFDGTNGYRLLTTADLENIDYVVERYHDADGKWYRVYKSGWVEQGGIVPAQGSATTITITLLKAMKNTNYTVLSNPISVNTQTTSNNYVNVFNITTTSFNLQVWNFAAKRWCVFGQGAN